MATGLSSLISNTGVQTTTMPSWFDTAQQNVVSQAQAANAAAPTPQSTVAQNAVNTLSGATNPFTQAGGTLQNIASGAASPWNVSPTGQVTPNVNTALGGLFQAQNQQLQQLAPTIQAQQEAQNIGSGNFGSLRGQTADVSALTNAQAQLASQQNAVALQNQSAGVNAAIGAGNVTQQDINNLLTTGQYQQASPYINAANLGNVLSTVQPGATVSNTTNLSPLNQVMGLATALGGTGVSTGGLLSGLFGSGSGGSPTITNPVTGLPMANPNYVAPGLFSSLFGSSSSQPAATSTNTSPLAAVSTGQDTSGQYSGSSSTPTSTGATTAQDIQQAATDAGYTTPIGGDTGS